MGVKPAVDGGVKFVAVGDVHGDHVGAMVEVALLDVADVYEEIPLWTDTRLDCGGVVLCWMETRFDCGGVDRA